MLTVCCWSRETPFPLGADGEVPGLLSPRLERCSNPPGEGTEKLAGFPTGPEQSSPGVTRQGEGLLPRDMTQLQGLCPVSTTSP